MLTLDCLRFVEVMDHDLDVWGRQSLLEGLWNVLQDHSSGKVWIFGPQSCTLVAYTSTDVYKEGLLRIFAPIRALGLDGEDRQPVRHFTSLANHIVVEVCHVLRMRWEPDESWHVRLMSNLEGSLIVFGDILIFSVCEKLGEALIARSEGIMTASDGVRVIVSSIDFTY